MPNFLMKKVFLIIFFVFLFGAVGKSQYIEMKFIDILNRKQLTSSFTSCIAQDSIGFMWIGTNDGLNRYDGHTVKHYFHVPGDTASLINNSVLVMHVDPGGRLWIGTHNGICYYNEQKDNFVVISTETSPNGLHGFTIKNIINGPDNKLYVAAGNTVYVYNEQNNTFKEYISVDEKEIYNFVFDENNTLWIGISLGGLYHYSNKGKLIKHYNEVDNGKGIIKLRIKDIALRSDELWIATNGSGVNVLNVNSKQFSFINSDGGEYSRYAAGVYIDNNDRVWIIDVTGLKYFDDNNKQVYGYYPSEDDKFSLKPSIIGIFQDNQDNYWTIHEPGGCGLRVTPRGFSGYSTFSPVPWGLSQKQVSAISIDGAGNYWFGYNSGGVDILNWKKNKVVSYSHDKLNPYSLGESTVESIFKDSRNVMWVGTYQKGLHYFDPQSQKFYSFVHNPKDTTSIASNDIRDIVEDKEGNFWVATHGKGIDKFDVQNKTFTHFTVSRNNLSNEWTYDLMIDNEESLWVTSAWGLSKLKKGAKRFKRYYQKMDDDNSPSSNQFVCLHQDALNRVWVGTSEGLDLYNPESDNFTRIKSRFGNIYIQGILSDKNNNLWLSTLSGLKMYNPSTKSWLSFDETDGLVSEEYYPRSVYKAGDGHLLFGGAKGVDVINVDNLYLNKTAPKVVLTDFQLFYKSVNNYGANSPLKSSIITANEIELGYHQNIIGFEFTALNMNQSFKNEYAYQMVGFDKDWVYSGTRNNAFYTNLSPGEYVFRVKACNNDKIWNEEGTSIKVIIHPPWWMTWWAISLMVLFVLLLFLLVYVVRTKALKQQKINLEKQVKEKTKELSSKNEILIKQTDDLNNMNTRLEESRQSIEEYSVNLRAMVLELEKSNASKNRLFSIISHDLRSPFNSILGFLNLLYTRFSKLEDDRKLFMLDQINQSSKRVYNLLENLLTWSKTQINEITYTPLNLEITQLLEDIIVVFSPQLDAKKILVQMSFEEKTEVYADKDMMNVVFRNLISNAIKFTQEGGTIWLESAINKNKAQITVKDSGSGMDEDILKGLFEISKQKIRPGTQGESGSGLGLILCKEFVERNNGTIDVESKIGEGSRFIVEIPVARE